MKSAIVKLEHESSELVVAMMQFILLKQEHTTLDTSEVAEIIIC